jgi:hypothetical protein
VLVLATGCPAATTTTATPSEHATEPSEKVLGESLIPSEPANRAVGDEIEATITIAGGGAIQLSSLRGRPVLLEISASWEPGFAEAHALYAELIVEHPELAVIVVLADPDDGALLRIPSGLTPAWDPAGALAARLSVASFPTMFVIDRSGRIGEVVNGWNDSVRQQLRAAVTSVNQP